jgi:hypothetical protein
LIDNAFRNALSRHAGPLVSSFVNLYGRLGLSPNALSVLALLVAVSAGRGA